MAVQQHARPLLAEPADVRGNRAAMWLLEEEARAFLTRLRQIRPFAMQETMLPAAALTPTAQVAIDTLLAHGRRALRDRVGAFLAWLRGPGRAATPEEAQREFALIRMNFNDVLSQFDLFSNVISQRART